MIGFRVSILGSQVFCNLKLSMSNDEGGGRRQAKKFREF